jgi:Protein of unknown function (DUF2855)
VLGDWLGYWGHFPAPEGWGHVPAWGFATAIASRSPALAEGARVFGFVPMASHLTVRPAPHPLGFVDAAPHRADVKRIYVQYLAVEGEGDDAELVWRPLFGTAVVLDLLLDEAEFHGAGTVVLTSASSKTACGLAFLLRDQPVRTVGLTSPARRDWVRGVELYDAVLGYDELASLDAPDDAVLVDFAGDGALVHRVHDRLGAALRRSLLVGYTHRRDEAVAPPPSAEVFSAPDEIARRGRALAAPYAQAWKRFAPLAERIARLERLADGDAIVRTYRALLEGRADPGIGYVASLAP